MFKPLRALIAGVLAALMPGLGLYPFALYPYAVEGNYLPSPKGTFSTNQLTFPLRLRDLMPLMPQRPLFYSNSS